MSEYGPHFTIGLQQARKILKDTKEFRRFIKEIEAFVKMYEGI